MRRLAAMLLLAVAGTVDAHPLAPALLELRALDARDYAVTWRSAVAQVRGTAVTAQLPASCVRLSEPVAGIEGGDALVARWTVRCESGLAGTTLAVTGLRESGINVVVRIAGADGIDHRALLTASAPGFAVPETRAPAPVFGRYLRLGAGHLLTGLDHLLFLLGLFVLVPRLRALVATVTAFTAGHCATLSLATLGLLPVRQEPAEVAIAATILLLGLELARPRYAPPTLFRRRPYLMAGLFGLVHGLGFAGALRDVGLPPDDAPLSLLAFNLGIEATQIALVCLMLVAVALWRSADPRWARRPLAPLLPAYLLGSMAVFWCLERSWTWLGPVT